MTYRKSRHKKIEGRALAHSDKRAPFFSSLGELLAVLFDSEFHRLGAVADIAKVAVYAIYERASSVA